MLSHHEITRHRDELYKRLDNALSEKNSGVDNHNAFVSWWTHIHQVSQNKSTRYSSRLYQHLYRNYKFPSHLAARKLDLLTLVMHLYRISASLDYLSTQEHHNLQQTNKLNTFKLPSVKIVDIATDYQHLHSLEKVSESIEHSSQKFQEECKANLKQDVRPLVNAYLEDQCKFHKMQLSTFEHYTSLLDQLFKNPGENDQKALLQKKADLANAIKKEKDNFEKMLSPFTHFSKQEVKRQLLPPLDQSHLHSETYNKSVALNYSIHRLMLQCDEQQEKFEKKNWNSPVVIPHFSLPENEIFKIIQESNQHERLTEASIIQVINSQHTSWLSNPPWDELRDFSVNLYREWHVENSDIFDVVLRIPIRIGNIISGRKKLIEEELGVLQKKIEVALHKVNHSITEYRKKLSICATQATAHYDNHLQTINQAVYDSYCRQFKSSITKMQEHYSALLHKVERLEWQPPQHPVHAPLVVNIKPPIPAAIVISAPKLPVLVPPRILFKETPLPQKSVWKSLLKASATLLTGSLLAAFLGPPGWIIGGTLLLSSVGYFIHAGYEYFASSPPVSPRLEDIRVGDSFSMNASSIFEHLKIPAKTIATLFHYANRITTHQKNEKKLFFGNITLFFTKTGITKTTRSLNTEVCTSMSTQDLPAFIDTLSRRKKAKAMR